MTAHSTQSEGNHIKHRRLANLDVIRGFAVLGILVMNVQSFSMIEAAYLNPTAYGDLAGWNLAVWLVSHLLFSGKFITLFSILFGAGILLFLNRRQNTISKEPDSTRPDVSPTKQHFRRMSWLLIFGLIHSYFIWSGDVLVTYAICGYLVVFCREKSVAWLALTGGIFCFFSLLPLFITQLDSLAFDSQDWLELSSFWAPNAEHIQHEINQATGTWWQQFLLRATSSLSMQTEVFLLYSVWRVGGLMLIGMALLKAGVFHGQLKLRTLIFSSLIAFCFGSAWTVYGVYFNFAHNWHIKHSMYLGSTFNEIGSIFTAVGYLLAIVALVERNILSKLLQVLAKVGKLAFSHYIGQSIFGVLVFSGMGLGLFGQAERVQQLLFVVLVWSLQIGFSIIWLKHYRQGPLEALWRRLIASRS